MSWCTDCCPDMHLLWIDGGCAEPVLGRTFPFFRINDTVLPWVHVSLYNEHLLICYHQILKEVFRLFLHKLTKFQSSFFIQGAKFLVPPYPILSVTYIFHNVGPRSSVYSPLITSATINIVLRLSIILRIQQFFYFSYNLLCSYSSLTARVTLLTFNTVFWYCLLINSDNCPTFGWSSFKMAFPLFLDFFDWNSSSPLRN